MSSFDHYSVYQLKVSSNRSFSARGPICHSHPSVVSIAHEEDIYGKNTDQKERLDRASIVSFFKPRNLQRQPW